MLISHFLRMTDTLMLRTDNRQIHTGKQTHTHSTAIFSRTRPRCSCSAKWLNLLKPHLNQLCHLQLITLQNCNFSISFELIRQGRSVMISIAGVCVCCPSDIKRNILAINVLSTTHSIILNLENTFLQYSQNIFLILRLKSEPCLKRNAHIYLHVPLYVIV